MCILPHYSYFMSTIQSINPATEEVNAEFSLLTREELDTKITHAHQSYLSWKDTPKSEKKALFHSLADTMEKKRFELAEIQTQEMGMIYTASYAGLQSTEKLIRWFADNFESVLENQVETAHGTTHEYQYDPLGVIYGIAPWNFPFNQVLRAAVPNILAGNTQIYKHASNTPIAGEMIEKLFLEAGFPQ